MWYLVRRHLGFSRVEWEALPWHDQLVYLEGLSEEFYDPDQDEEGDGEDLSGIAALGAQIRQVEIG